MVDKTFKNRPRSEVGLLMVGLLMVVALLASVHISQAVATAPSLGTAGSFAVLGGSTVTNTGPTVVTGDLGAVSYTHLGGHEVVAALRGTGERLVEGGLLPAVAGFG